MVTTDAVNFFLSRPRRFGKSLLVDTLRCYFEGRKELFEGLAIYDLEKEWKKYPVIHLNLSNGKYFEKELVHPTINTILKGEEKRFGIINPEDPTNYDSRLTELIKAAYEQTHEQVDEWKLGFPNEEVREGFALCLYQYYMADYIGSADTLGIAFNDLRFKDKTFEQFIEVIRKWYAGIPRPPKLGGWGSEQANIVNGSDPQPPNLGGYHEQLYQALLYAAFLAVGGEVSDEEQTSDGRMDLALKMPDAIYILELKYGKTAEEATDQIVAKNYAVRFAADSRPVWAVGLNISEDRRTIDRYKVVQVK